MEVMMKEKRKAEIALQIVRYLLKESGLQHDRFRGEMFEAHEAIGVSAKEIDKFFDALVGERTDNEADLLKGMTPSKPNPAPTRKAVHMTLASPRS